jgi:hypothetical protein
MNTARPTSTEVAQWIVSYLGRYPDAADTPLHIQRWWLAPSYGEAALEQVVRALKQLERRGVVSRRVPSSASQAVYGRGPRYRAEA